MKSYKLFLVFAIMAVLSLSANALMNTDCSFNNPVNNQFNKSTSADFILNCSVTWTAPTNITNMTYWFIPASNNTPYSYTNNTINGSRTTTTSGDFLIRINTNDFAAGRYTVIAETQNATDRADPATSRNSSAITIGIDNSIPGVRIINPLSGSSVLPSGNEVTFQYIPDDANIANCSLSLNSQEVKSDTTGTINPNVTTGATGSFRYKFESDNASVRVAIRCEDLAGQFTTSNSQNNFTFNTILGGVTAAMKQSASSGAATGIISDPKFSSLPSNKLVSQPVSQTFIEKYAWVAAIAVILFAAFAIKFKWFK